MTNTTPRRPSTLPTTLKDIVEHGLHWHIYQDDVSTYEYQYIQPKNGKPRTYVFSRAELDAIDPRITIVLDWNQTLRGTSELQEALRYSYHVWQNPTQTLKIGGDMHWTHWTALHPVDAAKVRRPPNAIGGTTDPTGNSAHVRLTFSYVKVTTVAGCLVALPYAPALQTTVDAATGLGLDKDAWSDYVVALPHPGTFTSILEITVLLPHAPALQTAVDVATGLGLDKEAWSDYVMDHLGMSHANTVSSPVLPELPSHLSGYDRE